MRSPPKRARLERIADELDDGELLPLDAVDDALTGHRRTHQAARWLARHGQLADARELKGCTLLCLMTRIVRRETDRSGGLGGMASAPGSA